MKRKISIFLLFILLIMSVPIKAITSSPHDFYISCDARSDFDSIKGQLPIGTTKLNKDGWELNYKIWHDKHIVVYGSWDRVPSNHFKEGTQNTVNGQPSVDDDGGYYVKKIDGIDRRGEYRYHGFDIDGNKYTNINFINDANSNRGLSEKSWLYKPWKNDLLIGRPEKPYIESLFNVAADLNDTKTQEWINKTVTSNQFNIIHGLDENGSICTNTQIQKFYNFVHVMSTPTSILPGEGRMWHRTYESKKIYYQTFSVPAVKKTPNIVTTTVTLVTPALDELEVDEDAPLDRQNDIIEVKVKVAAVLDDGAIYNNEVKRITHYSRYDVKKWSITLKGNQNEVIPISGSISTSDTQAKAEAYFIKRFSVAQAIAIRKSTNAYTFAGTARAIYQDDGFVEDSDGLPIGFGKISPPPSPAYEVTETSETITPDPRVPLQGFDIVEFPASDHSDMSKFSDRAVYINGVPVDDDLFFSGNYLFGDGKDGMKRITIRYTGNGPEPLTYEVVKWAYIYPTKPNAQFLIGGSYKQNRKITFTDTSNSGNIQFVLDHYPIVSYRWRFTTIQGDDGSRKPGSNTNTYKEFIFKTPGTYEAELTVTNALGRESDPYVVTFEVLPDHPAAVICNLNNSAVGRGEEVSACFYDAVSVDGDMIASNKVELFYDSDNNGTCEQLLQTWDNVTEYPKYTPIRLGNYKFVNTVREEFGEPTLPQYINEADRQIKVSEREFFVDNYIPMTGLYVDIPIVRPQIDMFLMMDKNLDSSKAVYLTTNRMNLDNELRKYNILPKVELWDMHTYTYSQPASTSSNTGGDYPPETLNYSSNGYSGTLSRTSVSNNKYSCDEGQWSSQTESKYFTKTVTNFRSWTKNIYGIAYGSWAYPEHGSSQPINEDGYSGSIPRTGSSFNPSDFSSYKVGDSGTQTAYGYYGGTLTKTVTVWVPNIVWYNNYTGFYSGTIYKNLRQPYADPFRGTSYKYVVYVSDGNIAELNDLKMVMSRCDARLILVGQEPMRAQIAHEHFILNNKPMDQLIWEVTDYIADHNQAVERYYVLAGTDTFTLSNADYDEERDPIIEKKYQYVQDANYFDNPTGMEPFALAGFSDTAGWTDTLYNKFNKPGEYHIYRRIKDQPSLNPSFSCFSSYSGTPEIIIYAHRKPIALCTLDWDYDTASSLYKTVWVDQSYDLDHQFSRPDKGIVDRKIMYRPQNGDWIYAIPDNLVPGITYEMWYYVKDPEGVWSEPSIMTFTASSIPAVQIRANLRALDDRFGTTGIPASEYLEFYDVWTRYPQNVWLELGRMMSGTIQTGTKKTITLTGTTGTRTGNDTDWRNISYQIPATLPDGNYTYRIEGVSVNGQRMHIDFPVRVATPVGLAPQMPNTVISGANTNITATTSKYASTCTAALYRGTPYQTTVTLSGTAAGDNKNWIAAHPVPANIPEGDYTARFTATTPNGNTEQVDVTYHVQALAITGVTLSGCWNHWRGQTDSFGRQLTNEPHRFLSLETVRVSVDTTGFADKVVVRFSPELEAMEYTDPNGKKYRYSEFLGYTVEFPGDSTFTLDNTRLNNHLSWEYSLPLAPSTKSWKDERLHAPYRMTVTAWRGNTSISYTIHDIEITGNIYDLTYIQPAH